MNTRSCRFCKWLAWGKKLECNFPTGPERWGTNCPNFEFDFRTIPKKSEPKGE